MSVYHTPGYQAGKKMKLSVASKMVESYADGSRTNDLRSVTMSASLIRNIIDQPNCEFVRVFFALEHNARPKNIGVSPGHALVFVGTDAHGKNIINGENNTEVYEDGVMCPPDCPESGPSL